jgi:LPLT family lysophospholipid transporter-like MFS transporter
VVMSMTMVHSVWLAYPLLVIIGALSGFFVVPMNALLQHRGHVLMSAGHSISVQNFNENVSILIMIALYALMVKTNLSINIIIIAFGLFVSTTTAMVMLKHRANQRDHDSLALIGEKKH